MNQQNGSLIPTKFIKICLENLPKSRHFEGIPSFSMHIQFGCGQGVHSGGQWGGLHFVAGNVLLPISLMHTL